MHLVDPGGRGFCGCWIAGIEVSNSADGMDARHLWVLCDMQR
jgi:hypothetical protein